MNEFDLIQTFFNQQALDQKHGDISDIHVGIGDDAAVFMPPTGQQLVTCCDTLIEGVHFPKTTPAFAIGYKAVAVNLSDLAAMGAAAHSILLALSLPCELKADDNWLSEFARGLFYCCHTFGVHLVGGDTTRSDTLTITITALGFAKHTLLRSGAQVGDLISVTGHVGSAAFVLNELLEGKSTKFDHFLNLPEPRVHAGQWLVQSGIATSAIDISDGLLQDLGHICQRSSVNARLDLEKIPTHPMLHGLDIDDRLRYQLSGGDDYELLFTFPSSKHQQVACCHLPISMTTIGRVTTNSAKPSVEIFYENQPYLYNDSSYQHF